MGLLKDSIRRVYRRYIHPHDPMFLLLRRSLKTLIAMALSLAIFWPWPNLLVWAPLAAFVLSQVPPGLPLAARRRAMFFLVLATALLVILATVLADGVIPPTVFVVLATLAAFGAAALGPGYGACALWALLLVVVALGKPAPALEGLARAGAVTIGGLICWGMHFLVLPMRARQYYRTSLTLALLDLDELWGLMQQGYVGGEVDAKRLERLKAQALKSLHRLRGLPSFLETPPGEAGTPAQAVLALGLDLVRVYENLLALWQMRQEAGDSAVFAEYAPGLAELLARGHGLLVQLRRAVRGGPEPGQTKELIDELHQRVERLRQRRAATQDRSVGESVLVFNSLAALLALARDLGRAEGQRRAVEFLRVPPDAPAPSPAGFWGRLQDEMRPGSPTLRAAGQAAVAAGASMLLVKLTDLYNGYWVVLFAILAVKPDLGTTLALGKRRLLGTCLGGAVAIAFLLVLGDEGWPYFAVSGAGAFITLYLMNFPHPVFSSGFSSLTMILITSTVSPLGWTMGLLRVGEVGLAMLIGLATARFLWPNRAGKRVRGEAAAIYQDLAGLVGSCVDGYLAGGLEPDALSSPRQQVQEKLTNLRTRYAAAGKEPGTNPSLTRHFGEVIEHAEHLFEQSLILEASAMRGIPQGPWQEVADQARALGGELQGFIAGLGRALGTGKPPAPAPDLEEHHAAMLAKLRQVKAQTDDQALRGRLTLSSFLWELRQMEREALAARTEVAALANA